MNIIISSKDSLNKQGVMLSIKPNGTIDHYQFSGNVAVISENALTLAQSCKLKKVIEAYLLLSGGDFKNISVVNNSRAVFDLKSFLSHW